MKQGIEGLESYLDRKEQQAQKVIDDTMAELTSEPKDGFTQAGNLLWSLRRVDSLISAAVHLRRYSGIRTCITGFRKAQTNEDPEFTTRFVSVYGEVTEQALIDGIDKQFTEELTQRARSSNMRRLGESELEGRAEMEFLGHYLDNKPWRWF